MSEIFFSRKIRKIHPSISVSSHPKDLFESFTLSSLSAYLNFSEVYDVITFLFHDDGVNFLLEKAGIGQHEIPRTTVPKDAWLSYIRTLAEQVNALYITPIDLMAAYLLITEPTTKLLFSKEIKEENFLDILLWARYEYKKQEHPVPATVSVTGEGIAKDWVTGWTLETQKYTSDFTSQAIATIPTLIDRTKEYQEILEGLSKLEKNNILLIGDPGVGKTALIKKFAYDSSCGSLSQRLNYKQLLQFDVGAFLAGTQNQGELETRLIEMIEEITHDGNIVLFIPDIENIFGASTFHIDLSGALLPYLNGGSLPIISTITKQQYKNYLESRPGLLDIFTVIRLEEPDARLALQMLMEKSKSLEKKYGVVITYMAISRAVLHATQYVQNSLLPGSAVSLLEDTVSACALAGKKRAEKQDVIEIVEKKTNVSIEKPKGDETDLLLHLEEKMHARLIGQDQAVKSIAQAIRRIRSGLSSINHPISFLFLGPTGVGKTETAKTLATLYFGGEDKMIRLDMSEYTTEEDAKRFLGPLPGEKTADSGTDIIDTIRDHPSSLVLLDEFEKANPKILDLFLQVLDDGRLTDNRGKTVSFINTIIIATSNAGAEFIREELEKGQTTDSSFQKKILDLLQTKGVFRPELLNRFDQIVVFNPLTKEQIVTITKLLLVAVSKKLAEQDITITFSDKALAKIADEAPDVNFGARPIRRYIQDNIDDLLSQKLLSNQIVRGNVIQISTDSSNNFIVVVASP